MYSIVLLSFQYTLTEADDGKFSCTRTQTQTDSFEDVFYKLRSLSYQLSPDVFQYFDGPINGGDNTVTEKWEYTNLNGLQYSPRNYRYRDSGTPFGKTAVTLDIQYKYFYHMVPHPFTFRVPYQCKKTVSH